MKIVHPCAATPSEDIADFEFFDTLPKQNGCIGYTALGTIFCTTQEGPPCCYACYYYYCIDATKLWTMVCSCFHEAEGACLVWLQEFRFATLAS